MTEKRLLQAVVAVLALVPVAAGAAGAFAGPSAIAEGVRASAAWPVDLDSHFRYLSGLLLALGLTFYATIPAIERKAVLFRAAASLVVVGGLARLLSLLAVGAPTAPHIAGLTLELAVVPGLVAWQARVARAASDGA